MSSNKRGNIFGQGKPERPYEERDDPADVPQRATAAQLASRKIKTAKARRPAGASSGLSQSANFGATQPNGFNFGASAPAPSDNGANGFGGFGGSTAFGGGATNSFPPAQSAAPSNTFSSSSFPAFGGSSQSAAFNPQPPASNGFNFTAGGSNPFATQSSAPSMNGTTPAPAFGGGSSMFGNPTSHSNPFGGLGQTGTTTSAPSGGMFGTSSSATSGGIFGTSSAAPSGSMFGTTSGASNAQSTPAPASAPFTFGAGSTSAQNNASTPATSGMFAGFGASTQPATPASAQNSLFSGFGANAPNTESSKEPAAAPSNLFSGFGQKTEGNAETPKPSNNVFGGFGTSTQSTPNATTTAPASGLFNFGATAQKPDNATTSTPSANLFGASKSAAPSTSTPASAPASNPFANLPTATGTSSTPFSGFGSTSQTPQAQEKAPAINLFSSLKKPEESSNGATVETPKPNPFAGLSKPESNPTLTSGSTPGFAMFGAAQNKDATSVNNEKNGIAATLKAPEAPKSSLFQPFSTPQPAKANQAEKSQGGMFSAAPPKTNSNLFSQTFQPETNPSNLFKKHDSSAPFAPQSTPAPEASKATPSQPSASKEASNPFAALPTPSANRPNLFKSVKEPASVSAAPTMPNLTGGVESQAGPEMPKIPKVHVPKEWALPGTISAQSSDSLFKQVSDLTAQLQLLNERYRQQLNSLLPSADWASVSLWHHQHATDIKKKIDSLKKQRAAGRGITGNESSLSTKRKINDESPEIRDPSPSKRARAIDPSASPTPQPSAPAPKSNPPATATSNIFAKAIGNKPSTPTAPTSSSLFAPKTAEKPSTEPLKSAAPAATFGFKPSTPAASTKAATSSGFKPSFGGDSSSVSSSTGFKPSFGGASTGSGGGFMAQFSKTAKTYEELAAERKKKAKDEDYDSDEETEEQWSARYDKAEAERLAEEKKKIAATPKFAAPGAAKPDPKASGSASSGSNPFAGLLKPASGPSTSGMFSPRAASPALSTGSQSVFNAPSTSQTPSSNIFGHLSSGPSSNNQDESEDEEGEQQDAVGSVEPTTPPKRKFGESSTESDETEDDGGNKKQDAGFKGSLLSRMTKDNESESEKENSNSSTPAQTNGTVTPSNKPFQFFDFNAASMTAPPKSDNFAGDQTFKVGTPIKFGQAPATEKKGAAPKFSFQPATPATSEFSTTPAKPPPFSIFNSGSAAGGSSLFAPNTGLSNATSVASSVFSSRAGTPLSEGGDTSAASAAEEDEEGGKQEQVDFSQLTEEETNAYDIVFHTEVVLAKHQVDKDGAKAWANLAKGPLWILKDKETGKCSVRVRIASGATPLNYQILPSLPANVTGSSKKMVMATKPAKEGGLQSVLYAVKSPEIAEEMAAKYMESRPSV